MTGRNPDQRPTIGVLINEFDGTYQQQVRFGMERAAMEYGANLIFFVGKAFLSPYGGENQHIITFTLAGKERLDGLVLLTGSLANFCGKEIFLDRIRSFFSSMPMVSVGWQLDGVPSVILDNRSGIRESVNHLIRDHRRRRIAFIRGPLANFEAEERFEAYREALAENGLAFDPNLVYNGDFLYHTGSAAVRTLLDERHVDFDALVSSNDEMLGTVVQELHRRGFRVPQDIAVTGCDDLERAEYMNPPYTTVGLSLAEQGKAAIDLLLRMLEGSNYPEVLLLPSRLVIRESCGCLPKEATHSKRVVDYGNRHEFVERVAELLEPGETIPQCKAMIEELIEGLERFDELDETPLGFLTVFNQTLIHSIQARWKVRAWSQVVAALKIHFLNAPSLQTNRAPIISEVLHRCQMMIGEAIWRENAEDKTPLYSLFWNVRDFVIRTNSSFDMDDFVVAIHEKLPLFGMDTCLVALYHPKGKAFNQHHWAEPPKVRLAMAWVDGEIRKISEEDSTYPAKFLYPEGLFRDDRPVMLVIQPLFIGEEQFGFLILNRADCEPLVYATFREQVSCVVRTIQLLNRKQKAEEKLKATLKAVKTLNRELQSLSLRDELTGLYNRRGFTLLGEERFQAVRKSGGKFLLFFMDLDGLKMINDNYGHAEGDVAIRAVAKILKKAFREPTDLIARFGGDEFIAIAFGCCDEQSEQIHGRIERLLNDYNRTHSAKPYRIQLSIGSAVFNGRGNIDFSKMLAEADKSLYRQKKTKKGLLWWANN